MSLIRSKGTKPEILVRKLVYSLGYRYRLHSKELPGHPDLVFKSRKKVIFVHGCFWHRHKNCKMARLPKTKQEFWIPKLKGNRERDIQNQKKLTAAGWQILVIWECEIQGGLENIKMRIMDYLGD